MEDELGVTLFENTSTGYSLTEAGLNLLEETEEVGEVIESSFRRLNGLDQRIRGSVVLATTNSGKLLPRPDGRNSKNTILKSNCHRRRKPLIFPGSHCNPAEQKFFPSVN